VGAWFRLWSLINSSMHVMLMHSLYCFDGLGYGSLACAAGLGALFMFSRRTGQQGGGKGGAAATVTVGRCQQMRSTLLRSVAASVGMGAWSVFLHQCILQRFLLWDYSVTTSTTILPRRKCAVWWPGE
jgi:hypothetical protein